MSVPVVDSGKRDKKVGFKSYKNLSEQLDDLNEFSYERNRHLTRDDRLFQMVPGVYQKVEYGTGKERCVQCRGEQRPCSSVNISFWIGGSI